MIEDILKKEYGNLIRKPNEILSIFSDFYGEDKVDLQGLPSLQEFVDYGTLNLHVINYFLNISHHNYSDGQKEFMEDIGRNRIDYDYSFNNPVLFNLFYQDFILDIIKKKFNEIAILVYFPVVNITNEHNRSLELRKLFCKVKISVRGLFVGGSLYFNRAEYSTAQLNKKYMHSHVTTFDSNNMSKFKDSCLGSGPIKDTILLLNVDYDELRWQLLCFELSKYVEVESLSGTPYNYLEQVVENTNNTTYTKFNFNDRVRDNIKRTFGNYLKEFTEHLIRSKKLTFNYVNGSYGLAMNYIDFNILISNEFITWWNNKVNNFVNMKTMDEVINSGLLIKALINNNSIIVSSQAANSMLDLIRLVESQFACTFKGQNIPIRITNFQDTDNRVLILNPTVSQSILSKILVLINVNYGNRISYTDSITGSQSTNYRIQGSPKTLLINN